MQTHTLPLAGLAPGTCHAIKVLRFGRPGAGPKAMVQAALHADEVPAMLVAHRLQEMLAALDAQGQILGEIVVVPYANPLGLGQQLLGQHQGRFALRDGVNFNRQVPDLSAAVAQAVQGRLGADAHANVALVRAALRDAASQLRASHPVDDLKNKLLQLAIDSDTVLDLHCDAEAVVHLYGLTPQCHLCMELGALLGAQAVLMATESGDAPFDEACSRPWLVLQQQFPEHPLPLACLSVTVELRGQADTDHDLARHDAAAIVEFLRRRGVVAGAPQPLPAARCQPTPLAGSQPVTAPAAGVVVFSQPVGAHVQAGSVIADLVDVDGGPTRPLHAPCAGVLYARTATRWAAPGERLAKIAGSAPARTGKLLSP